MAVLATQRSPGGTFARRLPAAVAQPALVAKTVLKVRMAAIDAGRLDPHPSAMAPDKALFPWMFYGLVRMKQ